MTNNPWALRACAPCSFEWRWAAKPLVPSRRRAASRRSITLHLLCLPSAQPPRAPPFTALPHRGAGASWRRSPRTLSQVRAARSRRRKEGDGCGRERDGALVLRRECRGQASDVFSLGCSPISEAAATAPLLWTVCLCVRALPTPDPLVQPVGAAPCGRSLWPAHVPAHTRVLAPNSPPRWSMHNDQWCVAA